MNNEKFDAVYTWVNSSDIEWMALYREACKNFHGKIDSHKSVNDIARYESRDEIYYSILSIKKYAPWINNIYIISNCKLPSYITSINKVIEISHATTFKKNTDLPTFNSHAIETTLHYIPSLSERFLYFNDDIFLCNPALRI